MIIVSLLYQTSLLLKCKYTSVSTLLFFTKPSQDLHTMFQLLDVFFLGTRIVAQIYLNMQYIYLHIKKCIFSSSVEVGKWYAKLSMSRRWYEVLFLQIRKVRDILGCCTKSLLVIVHITNLAIPLSLAPKFKIMLTFYGEIYEWCNENLVVQSFFVWWSYKKQSYSCCVM